VRPPSSNSRLGDGRAGLSRASAVQDWRLHQKLDRRRRRDRAVRQSEFRHTDCWRERRDRIVDTGLIKFLRQALERIPASRLDGASARSCWLKQVCSMAVARPRAGTAQVTCRFGSQKRSGGRPNSHHRRPGMDLGRDDYGHRPRAGDDRTGRVRGCGPDAARQQVIYQRRAGGHSQFSALLDPEPKSDRIRIRGSTSVMNR
jgi:hypothetical protein